MKTLAVLLLLVAFALSALMIGCAVYANYQYDKEIGSYWELADKASSIPKKAEYIEKFVEGLRGSGLQGQYNAVFLKVPDNSFDKNFEMLISLRDRLKEIQTMDVTSFQYNTAIQQITAQEQGEAHNMLKEFNGIWYKVNYPVLWNWWSVLAVLGILVLWLVAGFVTAEAFG